MNKFFEDIANNISYRNLVADTRSDNFTTAFGVHKNEKPWLLANSDRVVVYVTSDYIYAQQLVRNMCALGKRYSYLPHLEDTLVYSDKHNCLERNVVLYNLSCGNLDGVVVCVESLMQYLPTVEYIRSGLQLKCDMEYSPTKLLYAVTNMGYSRVEALEGSGQVVVRGDIVEVQIGGNRYRIDYWGDTIDNIVAISNDRTSTTKVDSLDILPITATVGSSDSTIDRLLSQVNSSNISSDSRARLDTIFSRIEQQCIAGTCYNNWLMPLLPREGIEQYIPADSIMVWDEPRLIADRINFLYGEQDTRLASLISAGEVLSMHSGMLVDRFTLFSKYKHLAQMSIQAMTYGGTFYNANSITRLASSGVSHYKANFEALSRDIKHWLAEGYQIVVTAVDEAGSQAAAEQLTKHGVVATVADMGSHSGCEALILPIDIAGGFVSHTNKLVVVGASEIGRANNKKLTPTSKKSVFLSVDKGDYVVHEFHGIGLYEGIKRIASGTETKDYLSVLYKNGDRLLVPAESSSSLARYSGGEHPKLSKIGGKDFDTLKSKVKSSIKEMSINLVELYASRQKPRGHRYYIDSYLQQQLADDFGYNETPDQLRSIEEVYNDLSHDKIMDRVLVGDVGFGKTEVALRAVFAVVSNGYQCAVLAPTTILSQQHYEHFASRLSKFDIKVACVNRFRTPQQIKAILEATRRGEIDVLIGTHRLLSQDVKFSKLALMVLDEEQRFGVEHKEKIKAIKTSIDVLTLSATPIPRTLHMALTGIRDISTIATPPVTRQAVDTHVVESNGALVRDILMRELNRGGQAFVLYNRVENIDNFASQLSDIVPEANIVVAHGQMSERSLEEAVLSFQTGTTNVMVCSTIIENGINMPNANTILVYDSDKLGLSQLYQLRGRVGRSDKLAFAYFMYQEGKVLSATAYKRLTSITENSQLGSGFKIAMTDLEIRGAGNILGRQQHGHMVKVGYDMYAKLLAESMAEVTGQTVSRRVDTEMVVDLDAYAPDDYIVSSDERMQVYQQISSCDSIDGIEQLRGQIADVYGDMPMPLSNLLDIATLRVCGSSALASRVLVKGLRAEVTFDNKQDMFRQCVVDAVVGSGGIATFASSGYSIDISRATMVTKTSLMAYVQQFLVTLADNGKIIG